MHLPGLSTNFPFTGTTKANDVFNISLVTKSEQGPPKTIDSFQPKWTYPIYEEEEIYGYKGVKINLRYNASDMRPHFSYTKGKEVPLGVADKEPTEIKESVKGFLPEGMLAAVLRGHQVANGEQLPSRRRQTLSNTSRAHQMIGSRQELLSRQVRAKTRLTRSGRAALPTRLSCNW